ncbi:hypothetical protein GCM10010954_11200 [Halobacillus andaensis]|uniref:Uncharacterized protein n=1 Tax=Halobacillus andaensis TaxID=1176239 RepID=A0A917ETN2_HALAA|nr:hypothetical protein [Halobacillus andaensis]MBP2003914.1 hypothetical protein [Halobacillus andaensis]GGF14269.1 hypothetical protein GCM10010954_11200 [Halobacillus andaensis]
MSLKKKNFIFIGGVVLLFGLVYWAGISAEGPPGRTGLGDQPDLSEDDKTIVFPYYQDGDASLSFQYEVFHMTREGEEVEQVTNLHAFAGGTLFFRKSEQFLITVDRNFAGRDHDFEYWIFDRDGSSSKEVIIDIPDQREGG